MLKRSFAILSVTLGLVFFLSGCSKDNHDTIIHIGNESYKSPIDTIYPKEFRDLWKTLVPSCSGTVYDGIFPPDITGLYEMEGNYRGGNEEIYQGNQYVPMVTTDNLVYYGKKYLYLLIEEQNNGIAKLKFKTIYRSPLNPPYDYDDWNEVDTAYIWGNGEDGHFTICFENVITMGSRNYKNGFIVNGKKKFYHGVVTDTISDMEFWTVIKKRDPDADQPGIMKVGGQSLYFSREVVKKEE